MKFWNDWRFMDDNEPDHLTRSEIIGAIIGVAMIIGGLLLLLVGIVK